MRNDFKPKKIVCNSFYRMPMAIHPMSRTDMFGGFLYQAEENMNSLEQDLIMELTALTDVCWWHRNIARHGFAINGYIKHYLDVMIMTQSRKPSLPKPRVNI